MTAVLVVGADATPSAAADRLLEVLGWLREHRPEVELHVVLLRGGPRIHRFHALAPTTVVDWYDRRDDLRRGAAVLRGPRRQRALATLIDRWAVATRPRRLPRPAVDVVLVDGWEALGAGPLGAPSSVPRVALLADGAAARAVPPGVVVAPGTDRRATRARKTAAAVLTGAPTAPDIWSSVEGAVAR